MTKEELLTRERSHRCDWWLPGGEAGVLTFEFHNPEIPCSHLFRCAGFPSFDVLVHIFETGCAIQTYVIVCADKVLKISGACSLRKRTLGDQLSVAQPLK